MQPVWSRVDGHLATAYGPGGWRACFLARVLVYAIAVELFFGTLGFSQGQWWLFLAQSYLVLSAMTCLLLLLWGANLRVVSYLTLGLATPFLGVVGLLQNPPNVTVPLFLVLMPILAGFLLERGEQTAWLGVAIFVASGSEWMMAAGHTLEVPPRPHAGLIIALNLGAVMVLIMASVRAFDDRRRAALERLEAASRARTIFLANVSHEIRTPMNGILGLTELLLGEELQASHREKLELVQRSGKSLVTLIDDLLLVTRAESGRLVLSPSPTPVAKVIADVVELFVPVARPKGVELQAEVASSVPTWVELDGVRWRQVLTNLVSNAVKFTERGSVTVHLTTEGERLCLTVKDAGPGIDASVQARLFRPFEQADASTTRRYGGTGLGLALSRQLIDAMGGAITLDSVPGQGSTFRVDVPLVLARVERPSQAVAGDAPGSLLPVLVVDDNPINQLVARGLVERAGYSVRVAGNGREALAAVAEEPFAMVLMDCHMPEMDGLEATRRIRASASHADAIIVAVTASGLPEELEACRRAGMNDCLVKPISLEMVRRVLAALALRG